jgi:hypothetical protein
MERNPSMPADNGARGVGDLIHRITDDLKVIAKDELELVKGEIQHTAKTAAFEAAVIVLGGIVALIGLGMLCAAAVAGLAGVIPSLALRLLLMAAVYIVAGGVVAGSFAKKLSKDIKPDTAVASYEAKRTIQGVKHELTSNEGRPTHA